MHAHARIRAEQAATLRHSLAGSSMTALTLVVASLVAAQWLGPTPSILVCPSFEFYPPPDRGGVTYTEVGPAPAAEFVDPAPILPIDEPALETTAPAAAPLVGVAGGPAGVADPASPGEGIGRPGPLVAPEVIPPPWEYVPHDEIPLVVTRVTPAYPEMARAAGLEGTVRVRAFVGTDGRIRRAEIEGAPSLFDDEALRAVRQWTFAPALSHRQPVAVWVRVPVVFRLR